jgi:hypothetical protein
MIGKTQILELVLIVVGVLVVLVMVGSTTGTSGILGNVQIANNIRNGIAVIGSLFVVFVLFIFLEAIRAPGSKKAIIFVLPFNEFTLIGSIAGIAIYVLILRFKARQAAKIEMVAFN